MPATVSYRSFNDLHVPAGDWNSPAEDPYIYTPYLCITIPQLLGIAAQFTSHDDIAPPVVFEANLGLYTRTETGRNIQWVSQGYCKGHSVGRIASDFTSKGGMTKSDFLVVGRSIADDTLDRAWL